MRLPMLGQKVDEARAIKQIRYAIDSGVNYLDTAAPYHEGKSEVVLGKALADGYRRKVKIATKLTHSKLNRPEEMESFLDMQLRKLQTDFIDYYLLHGIDATSWKRFQSFNALNFLEKTKKKGKIVNIGFSFHGSKSLFKEVVNSNDWTMCQIQYNLLDENYQAGTDSLKYAASKNLAVMIMEPLRGGLLANNPPKEVEKIYSSAKTKRSPAEWSLRWVWNHPEVTVVLSGMNDEKQIEENITVCETALPKSLTRYDLSIIRKVAIFYRKVMKVPCTACAYCMPCPNGVNIPFNFELMNMYHLGAKNQSLQMYDALLKNPINNNRSDASLCKTCGACEKKCPQHIKISIGLKSVQTTLDR
jgi:predicted aldo/keto reductase-like oxidoreductase